MSQLGDYPLERGILPSARLEEARRSKAVYGGRLGTNLVKLGLMELEEVAAHLSDVWGVPLAPVEWLEAPDARAAQVLPLPLIRRYRLNAAAARGLGPGEPRVLRSRALALSAAGAGGVPC